MIKLPHPFPKKSIKPQLVLKSYRAGETLHERVLDQKKLLIGSCEHADLPLSGPHASHYHAFLILDENGGTLVDLASENGSYINGERVDRAFFSAGDSLRFGDCEFQVEELLTENKKGAVLVDHDAEIKKIDDHLFQEKLPELPPLPGLVVIDGEYCDIQFDDDHFKPLETLPYNIVEIDHSNFIDQEKKDEDIVPIKKDSKEQALEVMILSNGVIISVDYYPMKSVTLYATNIRPSKNRLFVPGLQGQDDLPFIKVKKGEIKLHALPGFQGANLKDKSHFQLQDGQTLTFHHDDLVSFTRGTVQIMIRLTRAPAHLRGTPFFGREREAKVKMLKVFSALMSLALLLLLVDVTLDPPEEEIAVIYREAIKAPEPSQEKASEKVAEQEVDTGVKPTEQTQEAPRMAKKAAPKPSQAPAEVAEAAPPEPAAQVAKAEPVETKAYKFKMRSNMANLISSDRPTPTDAQTPSRSVASVKGFQGSANTKASDLTANPSQAIGSLGEDFAGDYDTSAGTKGLASKKGIDTTYIDPKTVVLGSMDPELLRRILQEYLPQFRHCYQQELERQGDLLQGIVDMNFRIENNGRVSKVDIKTKNSSFTAGGVECMSKVLRIIDFPKPKGGGVVDVRQPLNFSSSRARI